jgi:hypothetical protein
VQIPIHPSSEVIAGVYGALRLDTWIAFSEVYDVFHRAADRSWQIADGFVIAGYRIGPYIPYAQVEARHGDGLTDPFYNPDPRASLEAVSPQRLPGGDPRHGTTTSARGARSSSSSPRAGSRRWTRSAP